MTALVLDGEAAAVMSQISYRLHNYPGVPHGVDMLAQQAGMSKRALAEQVRALETALDSRLVDG